jgi:hypothetical protein
MSNEIGSVRHWSGRTLPAPGAPKSPTPPKFGGDPGFKGPSDRLKPKSPKGPNERLKPQPPKTKPLPYTGPIGGTTQKGPYTGPIGGVVKPLGGGN